MPRAGLRGVASRQLRSRSSPRRRSAPDAGGGGRSFRAPQTADPESAGRDRRRGRLVGGVSVVFDRDDRTGREQVEPQLLVERRVADGGATRAPSPRAPSRRRGCAPGSTRARGPAWRGNAGRTSRSPRVPRRATPSPVAVDRRGVEEVGRFVKPFVCHVGSLLSARREGPATTVCCGRSWWPQA